MTIRVPLVDDQEVDTRRTTASMLRRSTTSTVRAPAGSPT
jgi:hypothetical protein